MSPIGGLEADRELMQAAFKLEAGQVALVPEKGAPYVIKLLTRRAVANSAAERNRSAGADAVIRTTAQAQASQQAQKILATIKTPADFDKAAASNKLAIKNVDPFVRAGRQVRGYRRISRSDRRSRGRAGDSRASSIA